MVLPPPAAEKLQKEEKLYKSVANPQNLHFFGGGGEKQFYGQNDFMDIWAFLMKKGLGSGVLEVRGLESVHRVSPDLPFLGVLISLCLF